MLTISNGLDLALLLCWRQIDNFPQVWRQIVNFLTFKVITLRDQETFSHGAIA